ncbi:acyl-CoA thioesterase [Deinococcus wulumuqiensis]|uniref:Thioesterase n=1 Tax=Deinococcus wulumuqiensis TaxID=980427 RepID=A0A345IHW8_9DEIO|nr:thioesterase family protein [Deinococcus wulumuqiensis]AXG99290.1 acyl-CoA thioesterase [Deinococcus wulumuqiensis]QII21595.1 acyl-CoA thioesterase [Deinococcus wulumuqiensis R12]GGI92750.1 thioesterase [Deinococcus wulumuqiensis]GGP31160.1 thioesterase [Deinococcus wulumuqiensis]
MTVSPRPRPEEVYEALDWGRSLRHRIQMRYADLDTMGHLNNAVYVQYFETARVLVWEDLKIPPHLDRSVIARQEIDYRHEVRWGQEVWVETLIERLGHTSWTTVCRMVADGQPCAYSRTVQVRVGEGALRPQPLEPELRERFSRLLVDSPQNPPA